MSLKIYATLLFSILTIHSFSQDADSVLSQYQQIQGVEIISKTPSANPMSKTLDYVYLNKDHMLLQQGNTFINTLERLPGISAINTGVGISKPVIRGMSLNRVIVNEYGFKQEGQQWGMDHGLEIDQFSIDRVEILKGPVSVLYGSEGIGGVINILPPLIPNHDTVSGDIIATYKSNNDLLGFSGKLLWRKKDFYLVARSSYQSYGSYKVPSDSFIYNSYKLPIYDKRLTNTGGNDFTNSILLGVKKNWGQSSLYLSNFNQKVGFFVGAFGIPNSNNLRHPESYRTINMPYQQINHIKLIQNNAIYIKDGKLDIEWAYQNNLRKEIARPHSHGGVITNSNESLKLSLSTWNLNIRHMIQQGQWKNQVGISGQYQVNAIDGYEFLIPNYHQTQIGIYDYYTYDASHDILLSAGIRLDYARQKIQETAISIVDNSGNIIGSDIRNPSLNKEYWNLSGSIGATFHLNNQTHVKTNFGHAYRIPAVVELAANGIHHGTYRHEMGTNHLNTEKGWLFDVAYHWDHPKWHITVSPFINYFDNYIFLRPSGKFSPLPEGGQIYQYQQAKSMFTGFELSIENDVDDFFSNETSVEYVWNKNLNSHTPLLFTPPFSILHEWKFTGDKLATTLFKDFQWSINGQYFAAQNRVDRNEKTTPGYLLFNTQLSKKLVIGKQHFTIYLQGRNLLNAAYYNNMSKYRLLNLYEPGRNIQLMIRWNF